VPSPAWLRTRLSDAGMRPITNVVDVTNYVMLALGNPLHAFDYATLAESRIVVRRAKKGEGAAHAGRRAPKLDPDDLLIADAKRGDRARGDHGRRGHRDNGSDDGRLARGGQLRSVHDLPQLGNASACARRVEPLGEGRRSVPRSGGRDDGDRAHRRVDGARWVGNEDVHEQLPERPVISYRPERADEVIGIATPAEEQHALLRSSPST